MVVAVTPSSPRIFPATNTTPSAHPLTNLPNIWTSAFAIRSSSFTDLTFFTHLTHSILFICFVKVKECLNIGAILKAALAFHLLEGFGKTVAPAALGEEGIEHENVFFVWPAAVFKAPFENFFVGAAVESPFDDFGVFDLKKAADARIGASTVFVIGWELALGVQANLVEHPSEEDDAA